MPNIKLSKKQKEVIIYMRQGYAMMKNVTYVLLEMQLSRPSVATFFALLNKGMIKADGKFLQGRGQVYILTELGKSIDIN
jgi:hypothetical protein